MSLTRMSAKNSPICFRIKIMEIETKQQISERRREIEKELLEMLKEAKSDFGLDDIKEIVYNEDRQRALTGKVRHQPTLARIENNFTFGVNSYILSYCTAH